MGKIRPSLRKCAIGAAAACALAGLVPSAHAAQDRDDLNATLNVTKGCKVVAGWMNFGQVKVITPTVDTQADIDVRCTANTPFSLTLDEGQNAVAGVRNMRADKFPTRIHPYAIYTNAARTALWTPATVVAGNSGTTGRARIVAYGRVAGLTKVFPSPYRDRVTVTLVF